MVEEDAANPLLICFVEHKLRLLDVLFQTRNTLFRHISKQREETRDFTQNTFENVTKQGLMSRTMAVHVRYKSLYISLPPSPGLQNNNVK